MQEITFLMNVHLPCLHSKILYKYMLVSTANISLSSNSSFQAEDTYMGYPRVQTCARYNMTHLETNY